jgi:NAD(P)-dependent dehydrogenase (short-subunit alcohol dehydrogenase family)
MAKTALVTGAAQRIGAEICRHLHAAGFSIALHYRRSATAAQALANDLNSVPIHADSIKPIWPTSIRSTSWLRQS